MKNHDFSEKTLYLNCNFSNLFYPSTLIYSKINKKPIFNDIEKNKKTTSNQAYLADSGLPYPNKGVLASALLCLVSNRLKKIR